MIEAAADPVSRSPRPGEARAQAQPELPFGAGPELSGERTPVTAMDPTAGRPSEREVLEAVAAITHLREHWHQFSCPCHACLALRRVLLAGAQWRRIYAPSECGQPAAASGASPESFASQKEG
jgi:hypothetical protein